MSTPVDPLSPDKLARLRELAGKATPGPWAQGQEYDGPLPIVVNSKNTFVASVLGDIGGLEPNDARENADAAYMAAASPDVVVALVDEIERARAELQRRWWLLAGKMVLVESQRMADAVDQLERFGPTSPDILAVLEALGEIGDDRAHGRDTRPALAKLDLAVSKLEVDR